jgi:NAD(P)-dependent dehydrogenase (short-subunit alcohol dehydrogenase family)
MGILSGKVAIVTGGSRGIGKGYALGLGEAGATVYVTGRTVEPNSFVLPGTDGEILPGSITETAEEVTRRGGKGVAVRVDHRDDDQVAALFEQVKREQGRLDVLCNNATSNPADIGTNGKFYERPLDYWQMFDVGVRTAYVAAWHAAQIMIPQKSGLIACTSGYAGASPGHGALFDAGKSALDRMAHGMARELKPHNVTSISMWHAMTLTERVQRTLKKFPERVAHIDLSVVQSQELAGRVVAALAADEDRIRFSGATCITIELAEAYGIDDRDGQRAPSQRETRCAPIWGPVA